MTYNSKYATGSKLAVAFVIAVIIYYLFSVVFGFYVSYIPTSFSCGPNSGGCLIVQPLLFIVVPIIALFLCVWSIFEVFLK